MRSRAALLLGLVAFGNTLAGTPPEIAPAVSVSPGNSDHVTWLTDPCPTFTWAPAAGAEGYELAVFELPDPGVLVETDEPGWGEPIISQWIPVPALSWTPSADDCLADGGAYIWYVRGIDRTEEGRWSVGQRFEVDVTGGMVADVVRVEVNARLRQASPLKPSTTEVPDAGQESSRRASPPAPYRASPAKAKDLILQRKQEAGVAEEAPGPLAATTFNDTAFRVSSGVGVVFDDPVGLGNIPAEGPGRRFMWYPALGALRAGSVNGNQWNATSTGTFSTATGESTTASGYASVAMGTFSQSTGNSSVALGASPAATGDHSTAVGYQTVASGDHSTALGRLSVARSFGETVIGVYNTDYTPGSSESWIATDRLFVIGNGHGTPSDALVVLKNGNLSTAGLVTVGVYDNPAASPVCRNGSTLALCSSSARYKDGISPLNLGMEVVERLRPITFRWKDRGEADLGFAAEEVAEVDPILVTYNPAGEIEGVKYRQLTAVLVNAIKEQQI